MIVSWRVVSDKLQIQLAPSLLGWIQRYGDLGWFPLRVLAVELGKYPKKDRGVIYNSWGLP